MDYTVKQEDLALHCIDWVPAEPRQLILLQGDLGAGKTTLVKTIVSAWAPQSSELSSPTYSVINEYSLKEMTVYHVDLYRMDSLEDLESTGFWDLFLEENAIVFVEWPERVPEEHWPSAWRKTRIQIHSGVDAQARTYKVT